MKAEKRDQATEVLSVLLMVDRDALTPKALLVEDLAMDSLDRVELVMQLEEQVLDGAEIDEDDADAWQTVDDVFQTLEAKLKAARKG